MTKKYYNRISVIRLSNNIVAIDIVIVINIDTIDIQDIDNRK